MEYEIKISGGFAGITQEYKGEEKLSDPEKKALAEAFKNLDKPKENKQLRDAFHYRIKLKLDGKTFTGEFTDANLPPQLRLLVQNVSKKKL